WLALSRDASHGGRRLARRRVGRVRKQAPRQVLPPDESRPPPARSRIEALEPYLAGHRSRARSHLSEQTKEDHAMPFARLQRFWQRLLRRRKTEEALDDELRSYLDLLTEQKMREGMAPEEARRSARIEIGGLEQAKEDVREAR